MKKIALILATIATLAATVTAPAEARGWRGGGWRGGRGIGLGIAAGALVAGAYGAYGPYGYGYGPRYYGYYRPRYAYTDPATIGRVTITDGEQENPEPAPGFFYPSVRQIFARRRR
jgi:hypothetical protein